MRLSRSLLRISNLPSDLPITGRILRTICHSRSICMCGVHHEYFGLCTVAVPIPIPIPIPSYGCKCRGHVPKLASMQMTLKPCIMPQLKQSTEYQVPTRQMLIIPSKVGSTEYSLRHFSFGEIEQDVDLIKSRRSDNIASHRITSNQVKSNISSHGPLGRNEANWPSRNWIDTKD